MDWLDELRRLRDTRTPAVVVTLATVRGHAPRNGGAKMVVSSKKVFGTVGGGSLEATAIERATEMLDSAAVEPELLTLNLSDKAVTGYGVQCCGGEVSMLLEPVRATPTVAIFGLGHVGLELARVLARQELDLHLVDSREEMLTPTRIGSYSEDSQFHTGPLADAIARITVHHAVVPESAIAELPEGSHVLVMTHDHAEDLAIVDHALRNPRLGSVGLIGSRSKWARFKVKLRDLGQPEAAIASVETPIGITEITGKQPAVIAVSVAARLLQRFAADVANSPGKAIK